MTPGSLVIEDRRGRVMARIPCRDAQHMQSFWFGWIRGQQVATKEACELAPGHAISTAGVVIHYEPDQATIEDATLPAEFRAPAHAPAAIDNRLRKVAR